MYSSNNAFGSNSYGYSYNNSYNTGLFKPNSGNNRQETMSNLIFTGLKQPNNLVFSEELINDHGWAYTKNIMSKPRSDPLDVTDLDNHQAEIGDGLSQQLRVKETMIKLGSETVQ